MIEYLDTALQLSYSIAPALIAGGLALTSAAATSAATGKMNKKSMRFQERMFDKTNEYNSPLEQRKRLEKAGLNPNLVYGGSSGGTAGTASQPAKPDFNTPDYTAIGQQASEGIMNYYNAEAIQANTSVSEAQADNVKQDTLNKAIDSVGKTINNQSGMLDYKQKRRLFDTNIELQEERLRNLGIQSNYTANKNVREERIANETVNKLKTQIKGLNYDNIVKKLDSELAKQNVRPTDPIYYRLQQEILKKLDPDIKKVGKRGPLFNLLNRD